MGVTMAATPRRIRTPLELERAYRAGWCAYPQQTACPWPPGDPARDEWSAGRVDAAQASQRVAPRLRRVAATQRRREKMPWPS